MRLMESTDTFIEMEVVHNRRYSKALGAGAHFVMLGGMLAGHNEGETQLKDGKRYFYGMSPTYPIHMAQEKMDTEAQKARQLY